MDQRQRAQELRRLHERDRLLVVANAWDAASARVAEAVGFETVATSSSAMAWAHGDADGENVPFEDTLAAVERMVAAVGIPVSVDFESGHVAATGNIERSELGNTDQMFLSNDPDTRSGATGPIPASVDNAMFTDPTNQNIESPALPSELRFDLDSYNGPSTLTSNGGFSPDVYCNVNGQRPS